MKTKENIIRFLAEAPEKFLNLSNLLLELTYQNDSLSEELKLRESEHIRSISEDKKSFPNETLRQAELSSRLNDDDSYIDFKVEFDKRAKQIAETKNEIEFLKFSSSNYKAILPYLLSTDLPPRI